jgi:predicted nucleic acid-binding protein
VVDANVAIKLVFAQADTEIAARLFAHLTAGGAAQFHVPEFFYAECVSALTLYVRQMKYAEQQAQRDLADLLALPLVVVPTGQLAEDALALALRHGISGYDAFYVAAAQATGAPLVTADAKLVRALAGKRLNVHLLADFPIPPLPA